MKIQLRSKAVSLISIAFLGLMPTALSQQEAMSPEEVEAAKQRLNQSIEQAVLTVMDGIELHEVQVVPVQKALISYFAPVQIERMKMQAERQKMARSGGEGQRVRGNREAIMARMAKLQKLRSDVDKKIKAILEKKQLKTYRAAMDKVMPTQRRPGGRGGPGGGR